VQKYSLVPSFDTDVHFTEVQKFERHETIQFRVLGRIDDTHSAAANLFKNAVAGNGLAPDRIKSMKVEEMTWI
jgi:hypothetical protein